MLDKSNCSVCHVIKQLSVFNEYGECVSPRKSFHSFEYRSDQEFHSPIEFASLFLQLEFNEVVAIFWQEVTLHSMRSSQDETVELLVQKFVHQLDSRKLKHAFVWWYNAFCVSIQNRVVFAPLPGQHRWPQNCYAVLPKVNSKLGKARHRTKKQRRVARNKFFLDQQKTIKNSVCSTGLSSFADDVFLDVSSFSDYLFLDV